MIQLSLYKTGIINLHVPPNADQDVYTLTSCSSSANGTMPIVTAAPYTLQNGTVIPAGTTSDALQYVVTVVINTYRNATGERISFVDTNDAGWYDVQRGNFTNLPDPANNGKYLQNCLQVSSTGR